MLSDKRHKESIVSTEDHNSNGRGEKGIRITRKEMSRLGKKIL